MGNEITSGSYDGIPAIETVGLGRNYPGAGWAVRDLNLVVPRGRVFGLLGLNGAGKSTTIRMLMGLIEPSEGEARVLGFDSNRENLRLKQNVGYVADAPNFYEWMTIREISAFVAHYRRGHWDQKRCEHLWKVFALPPDQKLRTLSKGQRSKVSLTLALAFRPDVLILDEPTSGLDPLARRQFVEGVLAEYMDGDRTILISSHLVNEIAGLVDQVGLMQGGKLVRNQPTEAMLAGLKRVRLYYENEAPGAAACTGLVRYKTDGREANLLVDQYDEERTMVDIKRLGAARFEVESLTLEDAFIELCGTEGRAS